MKKYLAFALAGVLLGSLAPARAADVPAPATVKDATAMQWRSIRVKNVLPVDLASWIDPQSQTTPPRYSGRTAALKPEGVSSVVGVNAYLTLLALCNDDGYEKLKRLVSEMDRPIKQVECELFEVVTGDENAARELRGADANDKVQELETAAFTTTLERLKQEKRIEIVNNPRMTTLNNGTAEMSTLQAVPLTLSELAFKLPEGKVKDALDAEKAKADGAHAAHASLWLACGNVVRVTPTVNNDGTITVQLQVKSPLLLSDGSLSDGSREKGVEIAPRISLVSTVNIKNGATLCLGAGIFKDKTNDAGEAARTNQHLYFVSARIVERSVQP